jgi:hypothetical protein
MGICQGRTCGPLLEVILSVHNDAPVQYSKPLSARIPVKAVSLDTLSGPIEELRPEN